MEIITDIIGGLAQRLNMRVYDKYPQVKNAEQYPLVIVARQTASGTTPYIRHLDISVTVVTREQDREETDTISTDIPDANTDSNNKLL